jgi:hypothetical protein
MADTISFRPTAEDREVLARLGENPTEAIRAALAIAQRALADEELRREALRLAADPAEHGDAEAVSSFMGDVFEDLPE